MWAGGKNKMIPQYLETPGIPTTGYDTYVEPFFGGGAMMIWAAQNCPDIKRFILNDVNAEIVGIYIAIKHDVDNFIKRMNDLSAQYLPLDKAARKKFYYALREDYTQHYHNWNSTYDSATLYFLMKTAFNGIWQTTKTSNGRFATPCGLLNQKDSVYDVENVKQWHEFLQRVDIICGGWEKACSVAGSAFYFMDPPYRDSFTSYSTVFDDTAHKDLIDYCKQQDALGHYVFYCNRDADDDFYEVNKGNLDIKYYSTKYTAGRRATEEDGTRTAKKATEILLHSKSITKTFGNGMFEEVDNT
jgi:DNA adenine methylase